MRAGSDPQVVSSGNWEVRAVLRHRFLYLIPFLALALGAFGLAASPWHAAPAQAATPSINGVSPTTGPAAGGVPGTVVTLGSTSPGTITVTGQNFDPATGQTSIYVGPNAALGVTCNSLGTQCTGILPPAIGLTGAAGSPQSVTVVAGGAASSAAVQTFQYNPPVVTSVSPASGTINGGTSITISGHDFTGVTEVKMASTAVPFTVSQTNSDTTLTAVTPPNTAAKGVDVIVTTDGGGPSATSAADIFTYLNSTTTVTGMSPTSGPASGGNLVFISGSGLAGATSVKFGGSAANYTVNSDSQITAIAPPGTGAVTVTVVAPGGSSSAPTQYTYTAAVVITGLTPSTGPTGGGNKITISGRGFTNATNVAFGNVSVSFTVNSDSLITVPTVPSCDSVNTLCSPQTTSVTVTGAAPSDIVSNPATYTYGALAAPSVTGVSPTNGVAGDTVTISGSGFTGATTVTFTSPTNTALKATASFTVTNDTTISATVPPSPLAGGGAGPVNVTVSNTAGASNAATYTYGALSKPVVTGLNPPNGQPAGGNTVKIVGRNLTGATSVSWGTAASIGFTPVSDTEIDVSAPACNAVSTTCTTNPTVSVSVTNSAGTSGSVSYVYGTSAQGAPTVSSLQPNTGPANGGNQVIINGTGFDPSSSGRNYAFFGPPNNSNGILASCSTTTLCTVTAPAGVGVVDVTMNVDSAQSQTSATDLYAYVPVVSGVFPTGGPIGGGTLVTISGSGFSTTSGQTTVNFGTFAGLNVNCINQNQCTAVTPDVSTSEPNGDLVDVFVTVATPTRASETSAINRPGDQFDFLNNVMTLNGNTADYSFGIRTISADVNGVFCNKVTQSFTTFFNITLPPTCGSGVITFFIGTAPAGYELSDGRTCLRYQQGLTVFNVRLGTSLPVDTSSC